MQPRLLWLLFFLVFLLVLCVFVRVLMVVWDTPKRITIVYWDFGLDVPYQTDFVCLFSLMMVCFRCCCCLSLPILFGWDSYSTLSAHSLSAQWKFYNFRFNSISFLLFFSLSVGPRPLFLLLFKIFIFCHSYSLTSRYLTHSFHTSLQTAYSRSLISCPNRKKDQEMKRKAAKINEMWEIKRNETSKLSKHRKKMKSTENTLHLYRWNGKRLCASLFIYLHRIWCITRMQCNAQSCIATVICAFSENC